MTRSLSVEFGAITTDNVEQLRKVNTVSFPVTYNEGFYQDVVKRNNEHLNKFAYYNGFVVGAVCTRLEPVKEGGAGGLNVNPAENNENESPPQQPTSTNTVATTDDSNTKHRLYIMTLAVLAAYRGRAIGEQLIQSVLDYCERVNRGEEEDNDKHKDIPKRIDEIALHVQISNEDAIRFYTSKFGFEKGEKVENYYRRIDPPHCYILSKKL